MNRNDYYYITYNHFFINGSLLEGSSCSRKKVKFFLTYNKQNKAKTYNMSCVIR